MRPEQIARTLSIAALVAVLGAAPAWAQSSTGETAGTASEASSEAGSEAGSEASPEGGTESGTGAGAGDGSAAESTAEGEGTEPETVEVGAATVLASVGDRDITLGEVISLRRDLPQEYQGLPDEILSQGLLDQLIDQTLMEEAARKAGIDNRLDVALGIRNQIRAVMAEAWMRAELTSRLSEERLRAEYDERYGNADPDEEIRAAHILVENEEKAADLLAQINDGADFAALAAEHGTDGTASRGGDLGWFVREDMVPQFSDAAFAIEAGSVGGPIQTPFGWHLIKVEEKRDRPIPSFEDVQGELLSEVAQEIQGEIMEELRAETDIVVAEPPVPAAAIRADDLILPQPE